MWRHVGGCIRKWCIWKWYISDQIFSRPRQSVFKDPPVCCCSSRKSILNHMDLETWSSQQNHLFQGWPFLFLNQPVCHPPFLTQALISAWVFFLYFFLMKREVDGCRTLLVLHHNTEITRQVITNLKGLSLCSSYPEALFEERSGSHASPALTSRLYSVCRFK